MGVKYSATDSAQLIQAMTSNLQVANQVTDRLSSGCDHLIASLESGELQGAAYTAGKGLFTEIIIPAIKKLQAAIDDIQEELNSYKYADSTVSEYGILDLDLLKEQLEAKQEMLEKTQAQLAEYQSILRRISDGVAGKLADNLSKTNALTVLENQLNIGIREIQEKIDKLEWFVAQVSQYFTDSLQVLGLAIQGATQLSQVLVDSEGNYSTDGIDMSWFAKMKAQKIQTISKKKYLEPKERLLRAASRNMMLSDEGDAYYRSQLKEKLKGKPSSEWDKIVDDYNHTLKIDNEGNIIDIFDFRAYKDRHYQKDDNFSVLKNGKYDSAYTRMVNEKYQELIQENFEANSVDLAKGVVEILAGLGIYAGTSLGAAFALEWAPLTGGGSALVAAAAVEAGYITAEGLVVDGTLSVARTLYEIDTANLGVTLSAASNYNSWQANKPTSKTISGKGGKLIEARVGNRKVKLRVDWEPTSGTNGDGVFQVQSGSGKSGYSLDEYIEVNTISGRKSIEDWVNTNRQLRKLDTSTKEEIINRIFKGYRIYYGN
ncbi:Bacillus transposase protein [Streptococcus cristatus]|uniref:LXG domain-containing protein n=2 Tax=Streptococcus cristatus TaxID=45634 RepID=A0A512A9I5_STRCR|nr:T7SS effector LXG polymorphic toxin [Streptococcus cristatus]AGK71162.1 hypothetical protein I872_05350 [Streptococcus cristatus AS 1.3089]GEN96363.1 hypothetical protein SOL01_02370 [Streptococcus cristatus]SQI47810.1 Bacillus transposase protein [Streptococcus cristatus]